MSTLDKDEVAKTSSSTDPRKSIDVKMPIPHIEIQAADGSFQAPSDVMRDMVESGVYDKVLAGSEKPKKKGGKMHKFCSFPHVHFIIRLSIDRVLIQWRMWMWLWKPQILLQKQQAPLRNFCPVNLCLRWRKKSVVLPKTSPGS